MSREDTTKSFCLSCGEMMYMCQCSNSPESWDKLSERAKYKKTEKQQRARVRLRKLAKQQLHKPYTPNAKSPPVTLHEAMADRLNIPRDTDRETLLILFNEYLLDLRCLRLIQKINQRDTESTFATNTTQISSDDPDHVVPDSFDLDALPENSF